MPDVGEIACGVRGVAGSHAPDCGRIAPAAMHTTPPATLRKIDPATGLIAGVRQVLSPHFDARPPGHAPGTPHRARHQPAAGGVRRPLDRSAVHRHPAGRRAPLVPRAGGLRVSAHALIRRDGQITQYVPFGMRAWHAGESQYRGRSGCNDFSIGVELEGTDDTPYTDAAVHAACSAGRGAARRLRARSAKNTSSVTATWLPGRKTDPGTVVRLAALAGAAARAARRALDPLQAGFARSCRQSTSVPRS